MCIAVPGQVTCIEGLTASVDVRGVTVTARLDLVEDVAPGDYVLVHAGFAITRMEAEEANETLDLLEEAARLA